MYSKFDVGYTMINEKATMKPQFKPTSLEDEYTIMQPTYVNTLPGTTSMVTPYSKVYSNDSGITNAYHTNCFASCKRHIRAFFE